MMTKASQAQLPNLPPATSCTSKDLELASAFLLDGNNDKCNNTTGLRRVGLVINNKTGSTRTAFGAWAILKRYDPKYNLIKDSAVFICAGPIRPNSFDTLKTDTYLNYVSGQNLVLTNIFLAWTTANQKEDCAFLEANPSKISPKCGTQDSIQLYSGVGADISVTPATCPTGKGTISVTPFGGKIPYGVKVTLVLNGSNSTKTAGRGETVVFDL
ncbi:MAG: hypothetical protein ACKO6K_05185, partial [Chitinophagaceae bacterium]